MDGNFRIDSLDGMAAAWEGSAEIRQAFRDHKSLLQWPTTVGVPSMNAIAMNSEVLVRVAEVWVRVYDFWGCNQQIRTIPVKPTLHQVKAFYGLMLGEPAIRANKVSVYRDAWGVRKLMSHALRNLRSDRIPRDPRARTVARVFIQAWFPDNLEEWNEQNFTLAEPVVPLESLHSEDSIDAFPFSPNESLDDESFEALMGLGDDNEFPSPLPPRRDPRDPNNLETLEVEVAVLENMAAEESGVPPPPATVESMDERIAFLQRRLAELPLVPSFGKAAEPGVEMEPKRAVPDKFRGPNGEDWRTLDTQPEWLSPARESQSVEPEVAPASAEVVVEIPSPVVAPTEVDSPPRTSEEPAPSHPEREEVPATQPSPVIPIGDEEMLGENGEDKEPVPPKVTESTHHILDEYEEKVLKRSEQDKLQKKEDGEGQGFE